MNIMVRHFRFSTKVDASLGIACTGCWIVALIGYISIIGEEMVRC